MQAWKFLRIRKEFRSFQNFGTLNKILFLMFKDSVVKMKKFLKFSKLQKS